VHRKALIRSGDTGRDVEARDLQHFITVAEELHFARAAARLHIVPAAVSQRVRDLEAELGVRLFERTSRTVRLTPAGRLLLGPARMVLNDLAAMSELARSLANGASGQARLGLAPNLGDFGARFVAELVRLLPGLEAVGHSLWGVQGLEALESGEVDAAVVRGPVSRQGITPSASGSTGTATSQSANTIRRPERARLRWNCSRASPSSSPERALAPVVHDRTVSFFAEHGVAPLWRHHRLQSYEQMMTFVAAGYASGLVHSHVADAEFPGVRIVPLVQTAPSYEVLVAWRDGDTSAAVARITALAVGMAREHAGSRPSS